jgi:NAD(P)-dependent dehydrogenase (short-subunit alcohol dehydrogenase family)
MLEGKSAIIYGAAGGIGRGVARTFAREGAHVFLAGRSVAPLEVLATQISETGGSASVAVVDAFDEAAVDAQVSTVVEETGSLDVSYNLISRGDVQGTPLVDMSVDDLMRAVDEGLRGNFITARAAARQMSSQGSGVVLHLNSASGAGALAGMGSTGPADAAVESFMRYLAAEVGANGVRVCGIWTAGVRETLTTEKIAEVDPNGFGAEQVIAMISQMSVLDRPPALAEVAETAAFLASDRAAGITGSMTNVTAGLVLR